MASYERVRVKGAGQRARTLRLEVVGEDARWLRGYQVDREGQRVGGRDHDQRLHIIDKGAIQGRTAQVVDRFYGELVDAREAGNAGS